MPPIFDANALHHALTGVLKQPASWGDAAHAAIAGNQPALWASVKAPILAFTHDDPAFADAPMLVQWGAHGIARPDDDTAAAHILTRPDAARQEI